MEEKPIDSLPLLQSLFASQTQTARVGARLQDYWQEWRDQGAHPWVVSVLKEGYTLEFNGNPSLRTTPQFGLNSRHPEVDSHILTMIQKGALEEVRDPTTPGFYSRIFLTPKRTGDLRTVIDLKMSFWPKQVSGWRRHRQFEQVLCRACGRSQSISRTPTSTCPSIRPHGNS